MVQADPGTQLSKGQQIRHGRHPFLEVDNSTYGPAIFYASAAVQSFTRDNRLLPEMLWVLSIQLLSLAMLFGVLRLHLRSRWLYYAFVLAQLLIYPRFHKYFIVLPVALVALALHRSANPGRNSGLVCGLLAGVAILFRLDLGLFVAIACSLALIAGSSKRAWIRHVRYQIASTILVLLPWLLFLSLRGNLIEIASETLVNSRIVSRGLSLGPPRLRAGVGLLSANHSTLVLFAVAVLLPLLGLATAWIWHRHRTRRGHQSDPRRLPVLIGLSIYSGLASVSALYRPDISHIKQALVGSLIVGALAVDVLVEIWKLRGAQTWQLRGVWCTAMGLALITLVPARSISWGRLNPESMAERLASWQWSAEEGVRRIASPTESSQQHTSRVLVAKVIQEVRELTEPGEPVLFLPFLAQAYYFAERGFDVPFGWFVPGRFSRDGGAERFIQRLDRTRIVVDQFGHGFDGRENRTPRVYAREVMEHIYEEYAIHRVVGPYVILRREPWGPSGGAPFSATSTSAPVSKRSSCESVGLKLTSVNTLPKTSKTPRRMPRGGNLYLRFRRCAKNPRCEPTSIQLRPLAATDPSLLSATPRTGWRGRRPVWLLDTSAVPPGKYSILLGSSADCPFLPDLAPVDTGARIEVFEDLDGRSPRENSRVGTSSALQQTPDSTEDPGSRLRAGRAPS